MTFRFRDTSLTLAVTALLALPAAAGAQEQRPTATVIAIPPLSTANNVDTEAGKTYTIATQIADLISADLRSASGLIVADVSKLRAPSYPEVTAPSYPQWRAARVKLLLSGFVNARSDGRLTVGCYVYDVQSGREVARQGFAVAPTEWRRAAHRCADTAYVEATGKAPMFDSRIAYVAQSGGADAPVKRLAIMDFDGGNHSYLTSEEAVVVTPRWSPSADGIAYTSFAGGRPQVRLIDVASKEDRLLVASGDSTFAPSFAPDGSVLAVAISSAGNTDIFAVAASGGFPRRLTTAPAIDTSPAWSPDGRNIAFVSDRSGSPQLYVMGSDGSGQRRISFGVGAYGSPTWSPDGEKIAFSKSEGFTRRIGVMNADGSEERIVTAGPDDEQPAWSPDGSRIVFQQADAATRRGALASVPVAGGEARIVPTPQGASDPAWGVAR